MATTERDPGTGYFLLGVMLGAAVGAALGLLYAPRPGAESRLDLAERSESLYQRASVHLPSNEDGDEPDADPDIEPPSDIPV